MKTRYVALCKDLQDYANDYDNCFHLLWMAKESLRKNNFETALGFVKAAKDQLHIAGNLNDLYDTMCYMSKTQNQKEHQA